MGIGGSVPNVMISPLPASLTYLQLFCNTRLVVSPPRSAGANLKELTAALPSSLLCLSLTLPDSAITSTLLQSIPRQCLSLTHCHIFNADWDDYYYLIDVEEDERAKWTEKLRVLREQLGAGVWCDSVEAVEQQRLDKQWQREARVEALNN